jgi:tetratricopeptide (TPR) repeat protein
MRKTIFVAVLAALVALGAFAQAGLGLSVQPQLAFPLGPKLDDGTPYYSLGYGGALRLDLRSMDWRLFYARATLGATVLPTYGGNGDISMTLATLGAQAGLRLAFSPRLWLEAGGGGGMYAGIMDEGVAYNPYLQAEAELSFRLSPAAALSFGGNYKYCFWDAAGPAYQGLGLGIGLSYSLAGARKGGGIRLEPTVQPVFPLFFSRYDDKPFGKVIVANAEDAPIEKVKLSFYAKQFMDSPKVCAELASMPAGATMEFPVYAVFNEQILRVTEGTKVAGDVTVEYSYLGKARQATSSVTLQVNNRNAMTWDDDRKVVAFVTAKDPAVLSFAKGIAATVRDLKSVSALTAEFRAALALFQGLGLQGLGYVTDPKTPYSARVADGAVIDFIQFPNQTLAYRGGDCDDLSVLYAALLESVGIETAFILVPGHIYVAFDSGLAPEKAGSVFAEAGDAIVHEGKLWIPVEITMVKDGFLEAWRAGAREWREAAASSKSIFSVRPAWEEYEPVGFFDASVAIAAPPSAERILASFGAELDRVSLAQVADRAVELNRQIAASEAPERLMNKLGILYARYGLAAQAREQFEGALERADYAPALVNLGNLAYASGDAKEAASLLERAALRLPQDPAVLIGLAKAQRAAGDEIGLAETKSRLAALDPAAAARFDGHGQARAAEASSRTVEDWSGELE